MFGSISKRRSKSVAGFRRLDNRTLSVEKYGGTVYTVTPYT